MKVLLISVNQESYPDPIFPTGLYYIARAIALRHQVEFCDLHLVSQKTLCQRINAFKPDLIGLSIRNIDNVLHPANKFYLAEVKVLIQELRQIHRGFIVLGGSGFSIMPEQILHYCGADFGVAGAGEKVFFQLLELLESNQVPSTPVLSGQKQELTGFTIANSSQQITRLNRQARFDWYYQHGGCVGIPTKRGCPHRCIYCTYPLIEGTEYQLRAPEEIASEIRYLIAHMNIRHFFFTDSIFNDPIEHSRAVALEIIKIKMPISWTAYFNPTDLSKEDLQLFKNSGCQGIDLGIESGSNPILRNYKKKYTTDSICVVAENCRKLAIPFSFNLLLGGPGETVQTLDESVEFVKELKPAAAFFMLGIRIYPKTPIHQLAMEQHYLNGFENLLYPHFYISEAVRDQMIPKIQAEALQHRNWIIPGLGINLKEKQTNLARDYGVKGALWVNLAK